jgi:D-arginine utilization repressor
MTHHDLNFRVLTCIRIVHCRCNVYSMVPETDGVAPICESIARLLSPHAEVVLHDPRTDTIVAIWNPMSGRRAGDASLLSELDELRPAGRDVYGPYPKSLADGRALSSVSAVMRDRAGHAKLVLCVNFDRTMFDEAARLLAGFAAPVSGQPRELFERDWSETVNDIVGAYVRETGTPLARLTRRDRLTLVIRLEAAGIFTRRRSVPAVARALGISRSMTYRLLAEARKEQSAHADAS